MITAQQYAHLDWITKTTDGFNQLDKQIDLAEMAIAATLDAEDAPRREMRQGLIVELGVYGGRALFSMGAVVDPQKVRVFGIDPWSTVASLAGEHDSINQAAWSAMDHEAIHRKFWQKHMEFATGGNVYVIRDLAEHAVTLFADGSIDLLHIDGNHSDEASWKDVSLWYPKVRQGGTIVFDDAGWATNQRAANWLREHCHKYRSSGGYEAFIKQEG